MLNTLTPATIRETANALANVVNRTPIITSRSLNQQLGGLKLFLKAENFQRVGAFKFRGAYNALRQLSSEDKQKGVVTHSSGNHAQGVALAAKLLNIPATIVMPDDAPVIKRTATAAYGAQIISCSAAQREAVSAQLVDQHNYTLIHPYDNDHVIAGQGTAAWELIHDVPDLDIIFTPVGGGGLISGTALAIAALTPNIKLVGVEPAAGDDANRSWRQGTVCRLTAVPQTIADGLRTRFIGQRNLAIMRQYVTDMTTVTDQDIITTLQFVWSRLKIIIEPSAAVALAPLFCGHYHLPTGTKVGIILSGGNIDLTQCGFFHQLND
ncbi:MAG TPA: pyridoxal-phosphate dependent enzyme [Anaerolineae bacterium]|nr:pyridoxal-phosphate dependent enzyme [Anaerolineae bacterium]